MVDGANRPLWTHSMANWQIFAVMLGLNFMLIWLVKGQVIRTEFIYHLFQEQVEITRLEDQLELWRGWFNLNFILVPLVLFLKFSFISFVLQFPLLFLLEDVAYRDIFRVVMIAQLAMLAAAIIQIAILYLKPLQAIDMENLGRMPLSLAGLTRHYSALSLPAKAIINRFNVFELIWCLIIYYKLKSLLTLKSEDLIILVSGVWIFLLILQWLYTEVLMLLSS